MRRQLSDSRHGASRHGCADLACGEFVLGDLRHGLVHVGLQVLPGAMSLHGFNVVFAAHQVRRGACSHQ